MEQTQIAAEELGYSDKTHLAMVGRDGITQEQIAAMVEYQIKNLALNKMIVTNTQIWQDVKWGKNVFATYTYVDAPKINRLQAKQLAAKKAK